MTGPELEHMAATEADAPALLGTLIKRYYDNEGEWAGTFRIATISRYRVEPESNGGYIVHVGYEFQSAPGMPYRGGQDQRTFTLKPNDAGVLSVTSMGGNQSASFD